MRLLLIVNATASSVTARRRVVIRKALAADHSLEVVETSRRGHAARLARAATREDIDVVVVLAGDGTLNEAADGLAGTPTALAALPGGSTNVYARTIGYSRDPVEATGQLLAALDRRSFRRVGVGVAGGRRFLFNAGLGFDAAVVRRVERHMALKRHAAHPVFFLASVDTWLRGYDHSQPRLRIDVPGAASVEGVFAIVSKTTPYAFFGSRPIVIAPEAGLDAGLSVTIVQIRHALPLLAVAFSAMATGRLFRRHRGIVHLHDLDELSVFGNQPFPWQVDGDDLGDAEHLRITHEPDALTIVMPLPDAARGGRLPEHR